MRWDFYLISLLNYWISSFALFNDVNGSEIRLVNVNNNKYMYLLWMMHIFKFLDNCYILVRIHVIITNNVSLLSTNEIFGSVQFLLAKMSHMEYTSVQSIALLKMWKSAQQYLLLHTYVCMHVYTVCSANFNEGQHKGLKLIASNTWWSVE